MLSWGRGWREIYRKIHTAAIDGTSECPGDPWDTSIPRMIVGTFDISGIEGLCSTTNIELRPPSYTQKKYEMPHTSNESIKNSPNISLSLTLALIFKRTLVRYWSLTRVGAMHWVTIPKSARFFFFQGPTNQVDIYSKHKTSIMDLN